MTDALTLLSQQRQALLDGDYPRLADLTDQLDQVMAAAVPSADMLMRLRVLADQNHRLMSAALAGFRAGQRRVGDILACRPNSGGPVGYDRRGRPMSAAAPARTERRS